jgi:branched-chain amino acid transport system substrate-binding protein
MTRRYLAVTVLALLAAVACGTTSSGTGSTATYENPSEGVTKDSIKLGWMGDASGPTVGSQVPTLEGIQAYIKWINDRGGINARKINLIVKDDKYQAPLAVSNFKDLQENEKVLAILGLNGSSPQAALAKQIDAAGIPDIGPLQTDVSQLNRQHVYNLMPTVAEQADVAYYHAHQTLGTISAAIVYLNVPSGVEWKRALEKKITADGGSVVLANPTPPGTTNLDVPAQKVAASKANVVFYHGGTGDISGFLQAAEKFGLSVPVYGWWSVGFDSVYRAAPPTQAGRFIVVEGYLPAYNGINGTKDLRAAAQKYGYKADNVGFTFGWVTAMVAAEGMKRAGDKLNRSSLEKALDALKNFDTGGLSPAITFGTNHNGNSSAQPMRWDTAKQQLVPIGTFAEYQKAISPGD